MAHSHKFPKRVMTPILSVIQVAFSTDILYLNPILLQVEFHWLSITPVYFVSRDYLREKFLMSDKYLCFWLIEFVTLERIWMTLMQYSINYNVLCTPSEWRLLLRKVERKGPHSQDLTSNQLTLIDFGLDDVLTYAPIDIFLLLWISKFIS